MILVKNVSGRVKLLRISVFVAAQLQTSLRKHSRNDWKPGKISPLRFRKGYFFFMFLQVLACKKVT